MADLQVLIPGVPGVAVETVKALMEERIVVERGCDPAAYAVLADKFVQIGMIESANRLLNRGRHYQGEAVPCLP